MIPAITQNFVNWIDGMKLNKDHFVSEQLAIQDRLRDSNAIGLGPFSFGILPPLPNTRSGLDVKITSDRFNTLSVVVSECRGITPGGIRVEISESNKIRLKESACNLSAEINLNQARGREHLIVISVNPLEKSPVGETNPTENPPRNPFSSDTYYLNVLPAEEVVMFQNGTYHLTIGKIRIEGTGVVLDDDFIPPAVNLLSHPDLTELHQIAEKKLIELEANVVEILQKIYLKKQTEDLAQSAFLVAAAVRDYLSNQMFGFRQILPQQAPIYFFNFFSSLARNIKNAMDSREGCGKEAFLSYIRAWVIETNQAEFESVLEDMINIRYDHHDIYKSVVPMQKFAKMIFAVFIKLAELDFIGAQKQRHGPVDLPGEKPKERKGPML
jgi:hypothetical protein